MTSPRNYGGRGAWVFIMPLFLLMTGGTFYFATLYQSSDQQKTALLHQEELHNQEIQSLRAQIQKLESELSDVGSIAQQKEDQLRQKEATLESVKRESEQRENAEKAIFQKKEAIILEDQKRLALQLKAALESKQLSIRRDHEKLILSIPNTVFFEPGSEALKTEGKTILTALGSYFKELPSEVEARFVSYHDNTPLQGTLAQKYPTLLALTVARAAVVAKEFMNITQLPQKRVLSIGMGETQPLYSNDDPQKKSQNRRMEVIIDLAPRFQEPIPKK